MSFFYSTNPFLYIGIAVALINAVLMCFVGYKSLQVLQLSGYKLISFRTWLKTSRNKKGRYQMRVLALSLASLASMLVLNTCFICLNVSFYYSLFGLAFYFLFCLLYIRYVYVAPKKTPLKVTKRMSRLIWMLAFVAAILTFVLFFVGREFIPYLNYSVFAIMPALCPVLVGLCHLIISPFENLNNLRYIKKAKKRLEKKFDNIIKIGIAGSYGKTSCKLILNSILSEKYNVCTSPNSFNTPLGLTKVILEYLKPQHEVLIAEMGARQMGDINYLCDLIKPRFAITTPVGPQHLSSFGSMENIVKAKAELCKKLPTNGYCVFDLDNEYSKEISAKCTSPFGFVSLDNASADCFASDLKADENGSTFVLHIAGLSKIVTTKLLGKHNILNILQCCLLSHRLGLSIEEICRGIEKVQKIPHRLELIKAEDMLILDNSYNSSPDGSKKSLETLALFKDYKKIIITPGLVELGAKEDEFNEEFAKNMKEVASHVIIVGEANKEALMRGFEGFENVSHADGLKEATEILKTLKTEKTIVLFENDLPDNYT